MTENQAIRDRYKTPINYKDSRLWAGNISPGEFESDSQYSYIISEIIAAQKFNSYLKMKSDWRERNGNTSN